MIPRRAITLIFTTCCLLHVCCSTDQHTAELISHAESIAIEHPDSARHILSTISNGSIRSKELKARHALLLSYSLDKCCIDLTSDSLIRVAVDYYNSAKKPQYIIVSQYLLGRIYYNATEYNKALVEFMRAEEIAQKNQNHLYLGLIYRSISDIYVNIYSNTEALTYGKLAYKHFTQHGDDKYIDWALADLGRLQHNVCEYSQAITSLKEVLNKASKSNNHTLYSEAARNIASSYIAIDSIADGIRFYEQVLDISPNALCSNDYALLGNSYAQIGRLEDAQKCLDKIDNRGDKEQLLYNIYNHQQDYKKALVALERSHKDQNSTLRAIITQNVTSAETDYLRYKNTLNKQQLKLAHLSIAIVAIMLCAIITILVIILRYRKRIQKQEIEENMALVMDLRNKLTSNEDVLLNQQNIIEQLFSSHFETINLLSSSYYEYQGMNNEKNNIYRRVIELINCIGTDKRTINDMVEFINKYRDNLMTKFIQEFPQIKTSEKMLFMYIVLGFSARAISIFMNENIDVVYNRKSRLKQRIIKSNAPNKESFLKHIY